MDDRWQRIDDLYHGALSLPPDQIDAFLRQQCPEDSSLRREVRELLAYDVRAAGFLEQPALAGVREGDVTQTIALPARSERVGPYHLDSLLGAGGMGEVYLATDSRLGRRVALKLLLPAVSGDPDARARFLREARSAAALNHPNIATVFDAGDAGGRFFLAMEFVDGASLRSMLDAGPLPEAEALSYAIPLASALEHAHSRGILHRDLKPENVLVDRGGSVKLVDFGIAKTLTAATEADSAITSPGMFVGTLKYAPPEVLAGKSAERQSDIYSFGVMLYEMVYGRTPFEHLAPLAAAAAVLGGERALAGKAGGGLSGGLAEVIDRSLSPRPDDRYANAAELEEALRAVRDSGGALQARKKHETVPALAFLEFENLSGDPSIDWLKGGIVETLEGELRKLPGLQVVSRRRAQQAMQGLHLQSCEPAALAKLGSRLGAEWIATGSFQRAGNRIRVTPTLVHVPSGEIIATGKVDGVWDDLFDVQDRVAVAFLRALNLETAAEKTARPQQGEPQSLDAYEHYASGRKCINEMAPGALAQAKQHFERALALGLRPPGKVL